jgi:hypothetical protein
MITGHPGAENSPHFLANKAVASKVEAAKLGPRREFSSALCRLKLRVVHDSKNTSSLEPAFGGQGSVQKFSRKQMLPFATS